MMLNLNNYTIRNKIRFIGFLATSIIFIMLLVIITFSSYLKENFKDMQDKEFRLKRISYELKDNIAYLHKHILTTSILKIKESETKKIFATTNSEILRDFNDIGTLLKSVNEDKLLNILHNLNLRYKSYYSIATKLPKEFAQNYEDGTESLVGINQISTKMFEELDFFISESNAIFDDRVNRINEHINAVINGFILVGITSLIVFMILGYFLMKSVVKSLKILNVGIDNFFGFLSEKVNKVEDIKIVYNDELAYIIKNINNHIHKAESLIENDRKFKKQLESKVEEKTKLIIKRSTYLQQYKDLIDDVEAVIRFDFNGKITYVNDNFSKLCKYDKDEIVGQSIVSFLNFASDNNFYDDIMKELINHQVYKGINSDIAKDGSIYTTKTVILPILNHEKLIDYFFCIRTDITQIVQLSQEIIETQKDVITTMGEIGETRSKETGFHVKRVAEYSKLFAQKYGLSDEMCELLYSASPMHDIGKVGIPDSILKKPAKLSIEEFEVMQTHAQLGYDLLKHSNRDILGAAATISYEHHEKWDGTGYPNGKMAEEIHIFGRITAIADVFDALGSARCYKPAWELDEILKYIKSEKGKHFEPQLVDIFFDNLDKFLELKNRYKDVVYD